MNATVCHDEKCRDLQNISKKDIDHLEDEVARLGDVDFRTTMKKISDAKYWDKAYNEAAENIVKRGVRDILPTDKWLEKQIADIGRHINNLSLRGEYTNARQWAKDLINLIDAHSKIVNNGENQESQIAKLS